MTINCKTLTGISKIVDYVLIGTKYDINHLITFCKSVNTEIELFIEQFEYIEALQKIVDFIVKNGYYCLCDNINNLPQDFKITITISINTL